MNKENQNLPTRNLLGRGSILNRKVVKVLYIFIMLILLTPEVKAVTSEEVIYEKEGTEVPVKEALDELYDKLYICTTEGNATVGDILSGKTAYVKGKLVNGSIPTLPTAATTSDGKVKHANSTLTAVYGQHSNDSSTNYLYLGIPKNTYTGENAYVRTPESEVVRVLGITGAKIAQGQTIAGINGTYTSDATATAAQILSGATAYVKGTKVTGSIASKGATTYTPSTKNQTIGSGQYLSGAQTIKGDANLVAGNIKKGTSIFGINGSFEGEYVVETFTGYEATVSNAASTFSKGTWKNITSKGNTTTFSYSVGKFCFIGGTCSEFREPVACELTLTGNYNGTDSTMCSGEGCDPSKPIYSMGKSITNFRFSRGFNTSGIGQYWYTTGLTASLNNNVPILTQASGSNYSGIKTACRLEKFSSGGYTIYFDITNLASGTGNGSTLGTRSDKFYLSGTVIYK